MTGYDYRRTMPRPTAQQECRGVCDVVVATCSPVLSSDVCLIVLRVACSLDLTWGISSIFSRSGEVRSHVPAMANLPKSPVAGLPTSVALGYLRRLDVNSGHRCNSLLGDRPLSDARQTYLSVEVRVECPRFFCSEIASPPLTSYCVAAVWRRRWA